MKDTIQVKIKKVKKSNKESKIPLYATPGAAGADLFACLDKDVIVKPGERAQVPTGVAIELPGHNGVGVVDSDFRGEIMVLMVNLGQEDVLIQNGDRIAQMLFFDSYKASFTEVEGLEDSLRGEGGFGSTGPK